MRLPDRNAAPFARPESSQPFPITASLNQCDPTTEGDFLNHAVVDPAARVESSLHALEVAVEADLNPACEQTFPLSIVIPAFNERNTLPDVLLRIEHALPIDTQTIIVDDASTDGTTEWLAALPPRRNRTILIRKRNHGKGSAVRLGIRHSRGRIVAIQDADLEYDPADLLDVIRPIQRGRDKAVYGSRYLAASEDPSWLHRMGNWALTAASNCMTGQKLTDMETCHKAFDGDLIRSIAIRECRFGFEPEITAKLAARDITISEVPTGYNYRSYAEGKKITWKDGVAAVACMYRYRTQGWTGRLAVGTGRVIARLPRLMREQIVRQCRSSADE